MTENKIPIVYMAAGLSSRFGGKIKQFARVGPKGETLIEYSMDQAIAAGFEKIVFIVGDKTEQLFKEKFGYNYKGIPVSYAKQTYNPRLRDKPWGSVDAICSALEELKNSPGFVLCNGDDIYGKETFRILIEHLKRSEKTAATVGYALEKVLPETGATNRGIIKVDERNYVLDIEEKFNIEKNNLAASGLKKDDLGSMNAFAMHPETLLLLKEKLEEFQRIHSNDRKIECLLPVEMSNLAKENRISIKVYPTSSRWFGVTNPADEEIVKAQLEKEQNLLD